MAGTYTRRATGQKIQAAHINELQLGVEEHETKLATLDTAILTHYMTPSADADANRVGIQALLDRIAPSGLGKGARMFIPPRWDGSGNPDPIVVNRLGANAWALDVPSNTVIEGAGLGSSLKLADGQANFTRMLRVQNAENVTIRNLRLDGNRDNNDLSYEHNHNIFVWNSTDVVIDDVVTVDATGDGVFIGGSLDVGSSRIRLNRIHSTGHKRNPVTVNEANDVAITGCYLICASDSGGQAVDSEPDQLMVTSGLLIADNILGHENPDLYAISTGGRSDSAYPRTNVRVIGNEFRGGGIHSRFTNNLVIANNTGTISQVYNVGYGNDVAIVGNVWTATSPTEAFLIQYSGAYGIPARWVVADNIITLTGANADAFTLNGPDDLTIRGGVYTGQGGANTLGINLTVTRVMRNLVIDGPTFRNFYRGVQAFRTSTNTVEGMRIGGTFDTFGSTGIYLDPNTAFVNDLVVEPSVFRNIGASHIVVNTATAYVISGVARYGATWSCNGTPEGVITERVGATAVRRDGGAATTFYVKESGVGTNTGWVAK